MSLDGVCQELAWLFGSKQRVGQLVGGVMISMLVVFPQILATPIFASGEAGDKKNLQFKLTTHNSSLASL